MKYQYQSMKKKNRREEMGTVRKEIIYRYSAHIYVFTSSTYNSACGDLEGARVSEGPPPPTTKIQIF